MSKQIETQGPSRPREYVETAQQHLEAVVGKLDGLRVEDYLPDETVVVGFSFLEMEDGYLPVFGINRTRVRRWVELESGGALVRVTATEPA